MHGDIKPSNILAGRGGLLKVTDFGISRYCSQSVQFSGGRSLAYAAPECYTATTSAFEGYRVRSIRVLGTGVVTFVSNALMVSDLVA